MEMSEHTYIERQLEAADLLPKNTIQNPGKAYTECYRIYNMLSHPIEMWRLTRVIDHNTGTSTWVWMQRS